MRHSIIIRIIVVVLLSLHFHSIQAQTEPLKKIQVDMQEAPHLSSDSIVAVVDSIYSLLESDSVVSALDTLAAAHASSVMINKMDNTLPKSKRDWSTWRPNPQRALWLALVIPGGGQIYNRKYWKLPIVYGGFVGCIYALTWNNSMYKDYAQAYLDIMDDDPGTASYNKFLHLGRQITPENEERYKQIFKSRKDKYRRWRDLSFFVMVGIYAVSVIDAYVDAELSDFDISKDLSLKVRPTLINNQTSPNPLYATSLGVNCSFHF